MKLHLLVCVIVLLIPGGLVRADDESHLATTKELMDAMQLPQTLEQSIEQLLDAKIQQSPSLARHRQSMLAFLKKYMAWNAIEPEMLELFMDRFSEDEMKELIEFLRSPVGRKSLRVLPELQAKAGEIGRRQVEEHLDELTRMLDAERPAPPAPTTAP